MQMAKKNNKQSKSQLPTGYTVENNTIRFSNNFNKPINEYYNIINKYTCLIFGANDYGPGFNQPLTIPINITSVRLSYEFNQQIILSPNTICVYFGESFNHPFETTRKLKFIYIGCNFDKYVHLPKYLEHLEIDFDHNQPCVLNKYINELIASTIDFVHFPKLPKKLIKMAVETNFDGSYDLKFSKNITWLSMIFGTWNTPIILPKNIKLLTVSGTLSRTLILTSRMRKLSFEDCIFREPIYFEKSYELLDIHIQLKYGSNYFYYDDLPNGTKRMMMGLYYVNNLPNDIKTIYHKSDDYSDDEEDDDSIFLKHNVKLEILDEWDNCFLVKNQFKCFDNYSNTKT